MGAVNRCWQCGTPFIRSETISTSTIDGGGTAQKVQLQVPPIRRAPVLAIYVSPNRSEEEEPITAIIADETDHAEPVPPQSFLTIAQQRIASLPIDYPSLGGSLVAVLANIVCYYSIVGVLLAAVAVISNVYLLSHRRSWARWTGFGLSILSLLSALTRTVATLYLSLTGIRLTIALFG
ncbi:hypothetical protein AB1K70_12925 [Bremerella sp. JC770]|uniref:hypothetical protein n=1 Tax=Bremerella sp. JC770 TaxID=3232137 RepID=UPI00345B2019